MTSLFDSTLTAAAQAAPVAPPVRVLTGLGDDNWSAASKALAPVAPVTIPGMARSFHPWQAAAYEHAQQVIAAHGGVILGDDMGLGKTAVLLALAAQRIAAGGYAIMIAPPVVEGGYITELQACFPNLTMAVVRGHKRYDLPTADIYFISDDSRVMQTWLTDVHTDHRGHKVYSVSAWVRGAALISRDELHRDKGTGTKPTGRAKVMLAVGNHCRATGTPIIAATGTLLSNRMVEAYIPLQIIGGERLVKTVTPGANTMNAFLWRYCAPTQIRVKGGRTVTKYGATDTTTAMALHDCLRRSVYIRREKSDIGAEHLPHSGWRVSPLALPDGTMRRYQRVEKDFYNLCAEERGKVWADKVSRAQAIVQMQMLREEAGLAKCEAAADYIADLVANGEQVVAFYDHTSVWQKLAVTLLGKGISVVSINGSVTGQDRIEAIEDFQAGDAQVCIAQVRAAGIGVTLTAGCNAVFVQCPWSAGELKQCADRILRVDDITKQRAAAGGSITWHVLQAHYSDGDPTFDGAIWSVLESKAAVCDAVNAGRPVTMSEDSVQHEALMAWVPSKRHTQRW